MSNQNLTWRRALAEAFTRPEALLEYLSLEPSLPRGAQTAAKHFGLRVPREFADRMEKGNPDDPLLRQVLPLQSELELHPRFSQDPVGDLGAIAAPGMLHKYQGRVLLVTTGACAINCRYCFRRHYPYTTQQLSHHQWQHTLASLARNTSISEVILSGGDPLMLSDERLADLSRQLERIEHLERLRLHTRLPIVLPARVNEHLIDWLTGSRLKPVVVVHCNHPNELSREVRYALSQFKNAEIPLLNQSVLLRGINDDAEVLRQLSQKLFDAGVLPYYLHLLDRVQGTGHFEVGETQALALNQQLLTTLPGYLVPRMVREIAGAVSKTPISQSVSE